MGLEKELNSAATVSTYGITASYSSHFIGTLAKYAKEYGKQHGEDVEIRNIRHIGFYDDEIIVYHGQNEVFHFPINIKQILK